MSHTYWIAGGLLGVLGLGGIRIARGLGILLSERAEVEEFVGVFNRYHQSGGQDLNAYGHLIERSHRVQELLGFVGVMETFVAPYRQFVAHGYNVILNGLPAMNRSWGDARQGYVQLVGETLVRYMGVSADRIRQKQADFRNPIVWFREGVAGVLLVPVLLLNGLGILPQSRARTIARSALFRVLSGVVALVGLVGSVITILLGWQQTVAIFARLLNRP